MNHVEYKLWVTAFLCPAAGINGLVSFLREEEARATQRRPPQSYTRCGCGRGMLKMWDCPMRGRRETTREQSLRFQKMKGHHRVIYSPAPVAPNAMGAPLASKSLDVLRPLRLGDLGLLQNELPLLVLL
eukprot:scaffold48_cov311-Pinguiococcus_pyrenoidosus.AAC.150